MNEKIFTQTKNSIFTIFINKPEKKNAITLDMYKMMADAMNSAASDPSIKVLVICSANDNFTAGNDLKDFLANPTVNEDSSVYQFIRALITFPLPIVCAVKGFAVGIGCTMLLHAEQVFADTTAIFSFPFINLGLVPEAGSTLLLPQLIGYQKSADLFLSGETFSAEEALNMGFVGRLCEAGDVNDAAYCYAEKLAEKPRSSLVAIKKLLRRDLESLDKRVAIELSSFVECLNSSAAQEAMSAFLEKRKPDFTKL